MKPRLILLASVVWTALPAAAEGVLPGPTAEQARWQDYEIGVFYHYDVNVFKPGWDHRQYDNFPQPEVFNPTALDMSQWMEVPKALGANYAVLTATHGSGFMLWQSDAYAYGMKQSPWRGGKGDIVKEFVEACRKTGVAPGLYCHMKVNGWWQVDHPGRVNRGSGGDPKRQAEYAAAKLKQAEELWGNYGPLAEIWFDGGLPDPAQAGFDVMPVALKLQPKAMLMCYRCVVTDGDSNNRRNGLHCGGMGAKRDDMARKRWIVVSHNALMKPVFYHCISRVVDRKFVFGPDEKEKFRTFMRMQENFSGCRVVAYCLMCNHIHLLVEVPPLPENGFTDEELLDRLGAIYNAAEVAEVARELAEARHHGTAKRVAEIHGRYTYRMHDLSEFMKTLMQRFTKWFNRTRARTGNLWEDAFKSVLVEDGVAAKTIAAYIDLNPVRAGMVKDPAAYRWSSYGEAVGGGPKGHGRKARAGLVRALRAHQGSGADAALWTNGVAREYRLLLLAGAAEKQSVRVSMDGGVATKRTRKGMPREEAGREADNAGVIQLGRMLRCRVRYFTDGAVIGSRSFVNEVFAAARERFGSKRKDGARKLRGHGAAAAGLLWSVRDLQRGIGSGK